MRKFLTKSGISSKCLQQIKAFINKCWTLKLQNKMNLKKLTGLNSLTKSNNTNSYTPYKSYKQFFKMGRMNLKEQNAWTLNNSIQPNYNPNRLNKGKIDNKNKTRILMIKLMKVSFRLKINKYKKTMRKKYS